MSAQTQSQSSIADAPVAIEYRTLSRTFRLVKRAFDMLGAALGLVLLAPLFALIGVLIRCDAGDPVFFIQWRGGEGGKPFRMYKFRTMVNNAESRLHEVMHLNMHSDARLYKISKDPRVTRSGAILRRYSLDELPQLFNVLKGDMSLVGPRPLTLSEQQYVTGWADLRATVPPGLTGAWQVQGRNEISFAGMMQLDCLYVSRWSFWLDCELLWKTVAVVLRPERDC